VRRPEGSVYICPLDVLHTVAPVGNGMVATVVVQSPPRIGSAPVYLRSDRGPEPPPRPISPARLRELFGEVDAAVAEEPAGAGTYCGTPGSRTTPTRSVLSHTPQPVAGCGDPVEQLHEKLRDVRDLAGLEQAAERLRDEPVRLRTALSALLDDRTRLEDVAKECRLHPNGFAKLVLHAGEHYGIRLHVWPAERDVRAGETDPHGHRWDFASWIVVGALRETTFVEDPAGEQYHRHQYHGVDHGEAVLFDAGKGTLRRAQTIDRPTGTIYRRSRTELHTAAPLGTGVVASLVLQRPHVPDPADVYRAERAGSEPVPPLSADRVAELLAAVVEAIR
jgi:hypothetical protein